ncbi:MAG: hypothetical protein R2911_45555 [Caldilineaceae bacterium]
MIWAERRAVNLILPLGLFRQRLFATATGHGFRPVGAMFGSLSFVPLCAGRDYANATEAGSTPHAFQRWAGSLPASSPAGCCSMNYRVIILFGASRCSPLACSL